MIPKQDMNKVKVTVVNQLVAGRKFLIVYFILIFSPASSF
tara:strand:+ start:912 stop:1031 length:120 start_codon:yes stop_codon:yes gene_type:complete